MQQLLYTSTMRTALTSAEIDDILRTSRRNNRRDGLTGLLVVGQRRFLQVLEGPTPELSAAYSRILADPRHFAFVELARRSIIHRSFPNWEMGHQDVDNAADVEGLLTIVGRLTDRLNDQSLKAELLGFASLQERAA